MLETPPGRPDAPRPGCEAVGGGAAGPGGKLPPGGPSDGGPVTGGPIGAGPTAGRSSIPLRPMGGAGWLDGAAGPEGVPPGDSFKNSPKGTLPSGGGAEPGPEPGPAGLNGRGPAAVGRLKNLNCGPSSPPKAGPLPGADGPGGLAGKLVGLPLSPGPLNAGGGASPIKFGLIPLGTGPPELGFWSIGSPGLVGPTPGNGGPIDP